MKKIYAFIANGTEETECLAVIDILKRAHLSVSLVSVHEQKTIVSSHQMTIVADETLSEASLEDGDGFFLPGGLPGSEYLSSSSKLINALKKANEEGKLIAAIWAAPGVVLGRHHLLKGRNATCFPGFEQEMIGGNYVDEGVVQDQNIITAKGLGYALDLGLAIVAYFLGKEEALRIQKQIQYDR